MGVSGFVNHVHPALRSLNCDGRRGVALVCAALLLLLPALAGDGGQAWLRYERGALAQGQWWRLLTAHFVHLDLRHALLNAAGLALVWVLFARDYSPKAWLAILLGAIAAIDAGLWLGDSTVQWYVGSSGALHGLMAAGAVAHIRRGERGGWVLAGLLATKLLYEQSVGALPLSGRDPVVVDAHLYGVLGGVAVAAVLGHRPVPL